MTSRAEYVSYIRDNPICFRCKDKVNPQSAHINIVRGAKEVVCPECVSAWTRGEWSAR